MSRASVKIILENLEQCPRDSRRRHNKPGRIERGETAERLIREERRERLVSKHIGYIPRDLSRDNWQICREEAGRGRLETTRRVSRDKRAGNIVSPPLLNFKFSPPPPPSSSVKPRFLATRGGGKEGGLLRNSSRGIREEEFRILCAMILLLFLPSSKQILPISIRGFLGCPKTRGLRSQSTKDKAFGDN